MIILFNLLRPIVESLIRAFSARGFSIFESDTKGPILTAPPPKETPDLIDDLGIPIETSVVVDHIDPNPFTRPGDKLAGVIWIVVHWTANWKASAKNERDYLQNRGTYLLQLRKRIADLKIEIEMEADPRLKNSMIDRRLKMETEFAQKGFYASAHEFIDRTTGEIVQAIPLDEIAYHAGDRSKNKTSIGIEIGPADPSGAFSPAAYGAAVARVADLCKKFGLTARNIKRHYDISGKRCPKLFVDRPETWTQFIDDVKRKI